MIGQTTTLSHRGSSDCNNGCNVSSEAPHEPYTLADHREAHREKRKRIQRSRRINHVIQNILAVIWAYSIPESQLRTEFEDNIFGTIFLFHTLQIISLVLFFWASYTEPGFLPTKWNPSKSEKGVNNDGDDQLQERESLLSHNRSNSDKGITRIDLSADTEVPPSFCNKYVDSYTFSLFIISDF